MKDFLLRVLVEPTTGEPLIYNEGKKTLSSKNSETIYVVKNNIPVILPGKEPVVHSSLHDNLHTGFNYAEHYEKDATVYDYFEKVKGRATRNEIRRLQEAIIDKVPLSAALIADIGCGNGWVAKHFLKKNRQVISIDISTINPEKALSNYPGDNHAALVADVFHLPLKNESVDCIIASEIMEHVYDPRLFVSMLVEKLKPGGKLIITTPYNEKIEYYLCVHCNLPTPKNAHLHSFNEQNIRAIMPDVEWNAKTFANKYLIKSRLNVLLGFLPFSLWKPFDNLANAILRAQTRFIIGIQKKLMNE